ncbi:MAG: hypothetical protein ABI679_01120 [Gemmatimonadota bacterium]
MGQTLQRDARCDRHWWRTAAPDATDLIRRLLSLVALILPARSLPAQDTASSVTQVGEVSVLSWPVQNRSAIGLAEIADHPAHWVGLGYRSAAPLRLVVVPDAKAMMRFTGGRAPNWGAGLAFPSSRTIILRADAGDLRLTLRHELAHLVLHDAVKVRVPLWFDEGYAAVAANEWDRMDALRVSWIVLRRDLPDFRELDGALRGGESAADKAYTLAMSAVLELGRRNPAGTLDSLLARLGRGEDFPSAVSGSTGIPLAVFESDWQRTIKRRYNLVIWLSAGGFWFLVSLLVGLAWWVRRRSDRPRRQALDEGWEVDPDEVQEEPLI